MLGELKLLFAYGNAVDISKSVFRLDFIKFYSFTFVMIASLGMGILASPPPLRLIAEKLLAPPLGISRISVLETRSIWLLCAWIFEWISLGAASLSIFKLNMMLEEVWQDKLRELQLAVGISQRAERIPDPVKMYNDSFDQEALAALRKMLWRAVRLCGYGALLVTMHAIISDN